MAFQAVPDTVELTVRGTIEDQLIVNTFYALKEGGYEYTDVANVAGTVDTWVDAYWLDLMSVGYTYLESHVLGLAHEEDFEAASSAHTGPGTVSGLVMPNNVALAVKRASALTGRSARGRIFIPGIAESNMADVNHVATQFMTDVVTALDAMNTALRTANWTPVIVSRYHNHAKRTTAVTNELVAWFVMDSAVDSQRRRLPGRGV